MKRAVLAGVAVAAVIAAAGGGYIGVRGHLHSTDASLVSPAAAQAGDEPIYYQDPDGRPFYSLTPKKTPDGRDYRAVPASADLSFEEEPAAAPAAAAGDRSQDQVLPQSDGACRILRQFQKRIRWGWITSRSTRARTATTDRSSFRREESSAPASSPSRRRCGSSARRSGRPAPSSSTNAASRSSRCERKAGFRRSPTSPRAPRVTKGQPLMEIYSPAIASAAAEYVATINSKTTGGHGVYGRGSRQRLMNLDVPDAVIVAMEKSGTVPITIDWSAPRDGIVLERNAIEGMRAQPGDVLFRVADISVVWATHRRRRTRSRCARSRSARHRPGARLCRPRVRRKDQRDLSAGESGDPNGPRAGRTGESRRGAAAGYVCGRRDRYRQPASRAEPFRKARCSIPAAGRRSSSKKARDGSNRATSSSAIAAAAMSRSARASPTGEPVVVSANFLIDAESNLKAALKGFSDAGAQP